MSFEKFSVLNPKVNSTNRTFEEVEVLFNLDHIISIKPIRISLPDRLLNGFWIRTTNGKKYKATKIPKCLIDIIGEEYSKTFAVNYESDDQVLEQ